MGNISQMEFNAIREIAGSHLTSANKLNEFAQHCDDVQIKNMFEHAAQDARKSAQTLVAML